MNAQSKIEAPANTAIWDALGKTDPAHTKGFKRSGGFTGTAVKPIWTERRLTEQFGPCGVGWGFDKPDFQLVTVGDEVLVYCTIRAWHGAPENSLWGVGGDKVASKNKYGLVADDEAFKKAATDAIGNAFKHIGCGADVHMGQFDDSKYVAAMWLEFADGDGPGDKASAQSAPGPTITHEQVTELELLIPAAKLTPAKFNQTFGCRSVKALPAERFAEAKERLQNRMAELAKIETNQKAKEDA